MNKLCLMNANSGQFTELQYVLHFVDNTCFLEMNNFLIRTNRSGGLTERATFCMNHACRK